MVPGRGPVFGPQLAQPWAEGAALPLTSAVFDVYRESCELGLGDKDQGAIREWFEHVAGIKSQS